MSFENHVLTGYVGKYPETSTLDSGAQVCKFSLATNRKYKDKEYTTWWQVEAWGKLGEICQQYVGKGDLVTVLSDRLDTYAYINDDNEPSAILTATARDVRFHGGNRDDSEKEEDEGLPF